MARVQRIQLQLEFGMVFKQLRQQRCNVLSPQTETASDVDIACEHVFFARQGFGHVFQIHQNAARLLIDVFAVFGEADVAGAAIEQFAV